jgi:hypothetical protein
MVFVNWSLREFMVSTRSRSITEPLALLTAGVVLSGAALVSAPKASAYCYNFYGVFGNICGTGVYGTVGAVAAAAAAPSYAITRGAILGTDVVEVAADAVAVVATTLTAAVVTVVSGLPLSAVWEAPSVQTVVARFNTDVAQLQTDWQDTLSPANFQVYVAGLTPGPAPATSSAAASVLSRHSRSAKPAATARAKAAATTRVAIVGGESVQNVTAPTIDEQAAVVSHRGTRGSIHRGTVDSANKPQLRD